MGRPRTKNRDLPERVYFEDGRYRYRPKGGTAIELGTDRVAALQTYWNDIAPKALPSSDPHTLGQWGDRYILEVVPKKAARTQIDNRKEWARLKPVFGDMLPEDMDQQAMNAYLAARGAITRGNREKALLSHMLSWLVFLGVLKANPLLGMQRKFTGTQELPRDRLVTDKELGIFMHAARPKLLAYVELKEITRLRKGDLLTLELSNLKDDGLEVKPRKNRRRHPRTGEELGKQRFYPYEKFPQLKGVIDRVLVIKRDQERRTRRITPWLFATEEGECYYDPDTTSATGFDSMWRKTMVRAKRAARAEGWELQHFTEHDLRARKGGTPMLLGNTEAVFKKHYDRGVEVVEPIRRT